MTQRNDFGFRFHDQVAEWYDTKYTEMGGGWITPTHELDHHLRCLVKNIEGARDTRILDMGCGDGQFLFWAANYPFQELIGIDISHAACTMAAERCKNEPVERLRVVRTSMENPEGTGLLPASFDYIISIGSLEHCLDIPAAARSISRLLKRGGRFLIYVPNEEWIHEDQPLETTMTGEQWTQILTHAGLHVEAIVKMNDNNQITGYK